MATNMITCPRCSAQNSSFDSTCRNCGSMLPLGGGPVQQGQPQYPMAPPPQVQGADKKIAAGICGILLGGLGIHKFILGYTNEGIIMLVIQIVGWFLCGIPSVIISVIGIIEGIMYLTKSDEEFVQTYVVNKKPWF